MGCVCNQPGSVGEIPKWRRWLIFVIGMAETMLWSGTIFGWASLVHVLKVRGIYADLCVQDLTQNNATMNTTTLQQQDGEFNHTVYGCIEQDEMFALMYTVACVVYSTPGLLIGYALHVLGLAFTRVCAGVMVTCGFLLLALTTPATPNYLWGAAVLLSVGGNTIRMAGLQFANLFPGCRNTAMAIISGIFTPSAGVLMLLQTLFEGNVEWEWCCWVFAAAASLVILFTPLIPRHQIPHISQEDKPDHINKQEEDDDTISIKSSVLSVSSFLHAYWLFINLFGVTLFATHFNSWINRFSHTQDEASKFSRAYGWANILCVFVTPLPGLLMDGLSRRFTRGKSGVMVRVRSIQAMIIPMVIVSCTVLTQTSMLLFRSPWAVYVGLAALMINRPSCLAVGNPFIRARFPADHFNRLVGIQGTVLALLTFVQYPHFTWAQHYYYLTFSITLIAMMLSLSQPLHLISKKYLLRALSSRTPVTAV